MMTTLRRFNYLSIWEIAHHYHGVDPDETNENNLPKKVKDKMREILSCTGDLFTIYHDNSTIPGFVLRVMNTGAKSFIVEKRIDGKVKRITLGRYGNLTVEQARKKASDLPYTSPFICDPFTRKWL